mmetsp:Transcript_24706/g.51268  ORF Transcript_24706/g.51268 Transcript_24706/m.51268 type:complete len:435 (+) Transcript_24706:63-1367(+)
MIRSAATKPLSALSIAILSTMAIGRILRPCHAFQSIAVRRGSRINIVPSSSSPAPSNLHSHTHHHHYPFQLYSTDPSDSNKEPPNDNVARVLFLGTPEVAATTLRALHHHSQTTPSPPYAIVAAVTQPPKRRKRRGKILPSPVGLVAEELGLPVLSPEKARDADFLDQLEREIRPDLCITAAYGQYLPKRFLALPKYGTLNIHPSLLPRWRGSSPVQRSLEAGDNPVGVSVLFTVSKMDAGPIVCQESVVIDENEQATTLLPKLFEMGTKNLLEVLPKVIDGEITMDTATVQDESRVVEAGMIDSSEGELFPAQMTAVECHNRVRGFSMWPGTYLYFRVGDEDEGKEPLVVKVIESKVLEEKAEPTNFIEIGPKKGGGLRLVCFDGSVLEMLKVQPATRSVMDAKSFVNGLQGQSVRWLDTSSEKQVEEAKLES